MDHTFYHVSYTVYEKAPTDVFAVGHFILEIEGHMQSIKMANDFMAHLLDSIRSSNAPIYNGKVIHINSLTKL